MGFQDFVFTFGLLGKEEEELKGITLGQNVSSNRITPRCIVSGTCVFIPSIQGAEFLIIHLFTDIVFYIVRQFSVF